jgi:hypothetical protein
MTGQQARSAGQDAASSFRAPQVSYVGYMASYPLAAISTVAPASIILILVAGLAGLTLLGTTRAATLTSASSHQAQDGHRAEQKAVG